MKFCIVHNFIFQYVPDYRIRTVIRTFFKSFIASCPKVYYKEVLLPVLSIFLPYSKCLLLCDVNNLKPVKFIIALSHALIYLTISFRSTSVNKIDKKVGISVSNKKRIKFRRGELGRSRSFGRKT